MPILVHILYFCFIYLVFLLYSTLLSTFRS
uniref:Uncharacterized protein n=1 Tax=Anguilla anguilla TaxID=7936 RepID=A0A0E9S9M6_ANGAN